MKITENLALLKVLVMNQTRKKKKAKILHFQVKFSMIKTILVHILQPIVLFEKITKYDILVNTFIRTS